MDPTVHRGPAPVLVSNYTIIKAPNERRRLNVPFLVDELDAAGADAGVVQRSVLGPLGPTHPTDICTEGARKASEPEPGGTASDQTEC